MGATASARPHDRGTAAPSPSLVGGVVFAVMVVVLGVLGAALLNDGDTLWHLATGEWILEAGALPQRDPFSYTRAGEPWIAKEWLSQLLLVAAHRLAGWGGVVVLTAVAAAAAFAVLAAALARRASVRVVAVTVAVAFVLTAPHLLARPHVLALPLAVAWTAVLFGAVDDDRGPPWSSLLLMIVWANLHAGASLGIVLAVAAALDAAWRAWDGESRRAVATRWGGFVLATVAAACVTPYGPRSLLVTVEVLGLGPALDVIPEWRPQDFGSLGAVEVVLLGAVGLALLRGVRLPVVRVLVLLGLVHLALSAVRNGELLGLLAPLVLVGPLTADDTPSRPHRWGVTAAAVAAGLVGCVLGVAATAPAPPTVLEPAAAVAAAGDAGATRLLHEYGFGGYLVRVGVPTFVDGRTELFGGPFVARHAAALALDDLAALDELLTVHDVEATLLRPGTPAVALLDRSPGWDRVHTDGVAVVHLRVGGEGGLGLPVAP